MLLAGAAFAAAVLIVLYFNIDPEDSPWFPKCLFLTLTGFKCPGCGTQRAIHCLLNFDFAAAIHYNAFLLFAIPVMSLYLIDYVSGERFARVHNFLNSRPVIITVLIAVLVWWVSRNLVGW
ncbi:MAG: DUF2752 domain-containing protein [Candidatus Cryptobacteroides sp.]